MRHDTTRWTCGFAILGSWALWFATTRAGQLFDRLFAKTFPDGFYGWLPHLRFALWLKYHPIGLLAVVSLGTVTLLGIQRFYRNTELKMLIHSAYLALWACFTAVAVRLLLAVPL
jgi:hypothetical protein